MEEKELKQLIYKIVSAQYAPVFKTIDKLYLNIYKPILDENGKQVKGYMGRGKWEKDPETGTYINNFNKLSNEKILEFLADLNFMSFGLSTMSFEMIAEKKIAELKELEQTSDAVLKANYNKELKNETARKAMIDTHVGLKEAKVRHAAKAIALQTFKNINEEISSLKFFANTVLKYREENKTNASIYQAQQRRMNNNG